VLSKRLPNVVHSLRFRLALSYTIIFGVLLTGVGVVFRFELDSVIDEWMQEQIDEDWNAAGGFLRIENGQANWSVDPRVPQQVFFVERLRRNLLLANSEGQILEVTSGYRIFGVESAAELKSLAASATPVWRTKSRKAEGAILLRYGQFSVQGERYLLAIGRRTSDLRAIPRLFIEEYFLSIPLMLIVAALFGWFMSARALRPVNELAETAQKTSASSLHLRIASRGVGDELDSLIDAFNKMMARLEENFDQVKRFSTDASHELRTPITGIRGQLEVALMTAKNTGEYRDAVINALEDVDRLSNIVRALLMLSQAETGQIEIRQEPVELGKIAADLAEQFSIGAADENIALTWALEPGAVVSGDQTQLERLVTNLLANAIKYTQPGGSVSISVSHKDDSVELVVADSGIGIAPEHLPHVFERFYRVNRDHPQKGLGLGLSFVAWIVKAHRGTIDVESELGKGTTFRVTLPRTGSTKKGEAVPAPLAEARQ
jgi:heavy metal sensor kinase